MTNPSLVALEKLRSVIREIGPMAVGFSAGVDSTFLLKVACDVLGEEAVAITTVSASLSASEKEEAISLARLIGASHRLVLSSEFDDPRYTENSPRRCYFCKSELFRILRREADGLDLGEYRPGMEAAAEFGARAPLLEAGLGKAEIRALSRELGLPTWNKPAMACLASRIPHGTPVAEADLARVDRAERSVRMEGFRLFRVAS